MRKRTIILTISCVALIAVACIWVLNTRTNESIPSQKTITKSQAVRLIDQCQVRWIYSSIDGSKVYIVLKSSDEKTVTGASVYELQQHENPNCPFDKTGPVSFLTQ